MLLFLTGTPELANEASGIFIWCLTQNTDSYKQWVSYYSICVSHLFKIFPSHFVKIATPCDIVVCVLIPHLFLYQCEQDRIYQDNLEASVAVLKKLTEQWKDLSGKLTPLDPIRETLKSFRHKVRLFILLVFCILLLLRYDKFKVPSNY